MLPCGQTTQLPDSPALWSTPALKPEKQSQNTARYSLSEFLTVDRQGRLQSTN